jgi:hypothetical protein
MKSRIDGSEIETKSSDRLTDQLGNIKISWMIHITADHIAFCKKSQFRKPAIKKPLKKWGTLQRNKQKTEQEPTFFQSLLIKLTTIRTSKFP